MNDNYIVFHKKLVKRIFARKKKYHHAQSKIPIEEKIKRLIELQKIDLTIRPKKNKDDRRLVWKI
jgi:hypothetical protein